MIIYEFVLYTHRVYYCQSYNNVTPNKKCIRHALVFIIINIINIIHSELDELCQINTVIDLFLKLYFSGYVAINCS